MKRRGLQVLYWASSSGTCPDVSLTKIAGSATRESCHLQQRRRKLVSFTGSSSQTWSILRNTRILVTDRLSIFIRQEMTRSSFVLRHEMRFGTALVTDVPMKTLEDYCQTDLDILSADAANLTVSKHGCHVTGE